MYKDTPLSQMRSTFMQRIYNSVRNDAERASEGLMGTMVGVLFLAIISASFAGIFMAYTVSSNKASSNTERSTLIAQETDASTGNAYIDGPTGKSRAESAGWTVLASGTALSSAQPGTVSVYSNFTYAAQKNLPGSSIKVSQWGGNQAGSSGVLTMFTAVPKSGASVSAGTPLTSCDWKTDLEVLKKKCLVYTTAVNSIANPPVQVGFDPSSNWTDFIIAGTWSPTNYATPTPTNAASTTIGSINVSNIPANSSGQRVVNYIFVMDDLESGQYPRVTFRQGGRTTTIGSAISWRQGASEGTSKTQYGNITVPAGVTSVDVLVDTNILVGSSRKPTVRLSQFYLYQTK